MILLLIGVFQRCSGGFIYRLRVLLCSFFPCLQKILVITFLSHQTFVFNRYYFIKLKIKAKKHLYMSFSISKDSFALYSSSIVLSKIVLFCEWVSRTYMKWVTFAENSFNSVNT